MSAVIEAALEYQRRGWRVVPVPAGEKGPRARGWPEDSLSPEVIPHRFGQNENVGVILGSRSGGLVDADLDCSEALALADLYLPPTGAEFGRASKPRSHRLYTAPGTTFAAFADPLQDRKSTILELRADGSAGFDGKPGAHQTIFPPSVAAGESREWHTGAIEPAAVNARALRCAAAWLATGCLVDRYISPSAARRPGPDLPRLLWEWDHDLARPVYGWLGLLTPDAPQHYPRRRAEQNPRDLNLSEIVRAIPNNCGWEEWNNIGLAIFAASKDGGDGFVVFDDFSAKSSSKYDAHETALRWMHYQRSPPTKTGLGKLAKLARQAGWRPHDQ
jgi:hypothetical protein